MARGNNVLKASKPVETKLNSSSLVFDDIKICYYAVIITFIWLAISSQRPYSFRKFLCFALVIIMHHLISNGVHNGKILIYELTDVIHRRTI